VLIAPLLRAVVIASCRSVTAQLVLDLHHVAQRGVVVRGTGPSLPPAHCRTSQRAKPIRQAVRCTHRSRLITFAARARGSGCGRAPGRRAASSSSAASSTPIHAGGTKLLREPLHLVDRDPELRRADAGSVRALVCLAVFA